ncbi:MAG TPA: tetratricopeptide repeat protein [Flavipsychrobacter sp.]|nr:tetratricopeptide repeat protein [Flavipsychrobacter sp.]
MKRILVTCYLLLSIAAVYAQQNQVRAGNKLYEDKKYKQAATVYQEALKKNPNYLPGIFNLGNALYQDKNYEASRKTYDALAKKATDPRIKASSDYNVGNTYMSQQKWEEAVNAYKQSLRKNPQDEDAKYNLSYALAKMKQNQGGGGKNKEDKKQDKKEKDKDKQEKDKEQQNKDKQEQNKEQQDQDEKQDQKDQQQEQKPQPQTSKLSEKQADQLLNALAQEEKKLHDKKEKGKAGKVKVEKDW